MLKLIDRIFTDKHANHAAIGDNYLLMLMYRFASPFAVFLHRLGMTPNWITTWSLTFSLLAFIPLAFDEGWGWFAAFWGMSVLLDFCDGTVARMSNSVSKAAFRYDHMSDLFKLSLLFLGVAIRYDEPDIWVLSFSVTFIFLYFNILNMELAGIYRRKAGQSTPAGNAAQTSATRTRDRVRLIAWLVKHDRLYRFVKGAYASFITVNGHSLLLFFLLPLGSDVAMAVFAYLILVMTYGIQSRIRTLLRIER